MCRFSRIRRLRSARFFSEIGRAKTESRLDLDSLRGKRSLCGSWLCSPVRPVQSLEDVMKLGDKVNCFVGLLGCQVHLKASGDMRCLKRKLSDLEVSPGRSRCKARVSCRSELKRWQKRGKQRIVAIERLVRALQTLGLMTSA